MEDNENHILKERGIKRDDWYEKIDKIQHLPEIKKRMDMLDETIKAISKYEDPKIFFDLPPQLNQKNFEIIQARNYYNYYYYFQKYIQDSYNQDQNINEESLQLIQDKVAVEISSRKQNLLMNLGIYYEKEKDFANIWLFALYNFSQDSEFNKQKQENQVTFQKITNSIFEKKFFKELENDPDKISDEEIQLTINTLKQKAELNNSE